MAGLEGVLEVEVIFALPLYQDVARVECSVGATVREVIECSGILARHEQVDLSRVGIWGRRCSLDDAVHDGDRIELYRALRCDPKEVRRRRAAGRHGA